MRKKMNLWKEVLLIAIVLLIFISSAVFYVAKLRDNMQSDLKENLLQVADMNSAKIRSSFEDNLVTLRALSSMLDGENLDQPKQAVKKLEGAVNETIFFRFGLVDAAGICYTTDDVSFDVSDREYYQQALLGKSVFTSSLHDKIGHYMLNVFAVPVYQDGEVVCVLFGSILTERLASVMTQDIFDGKGFSAIADKNGDIIVQPDSKSRLQTIENISDLKITNGFEIKDFEKNKQGVIDFNDPNGNRRYLAYEAMDINDWYVLSVVPDSVVSHRINEFILLAIMTWILMAVLFALILSYNHYTKHKNAKKMNEVIFHDSLTSHYNYNRLHMYLQEIFDQQVQTQYTLIEMDLCDFKMFNELYTYQRGDDVLRLIMKECDAVCGRQEYCARISSDHYLLCLHERDKTMLQQRIQKIIQNCQQMVTKDIGPFHLRFKCGVYLMDQKDENVSPCHDRCVYAKNQIEALDDSSISFYSQEMYEASLQDKLLEGEMKQALHRGEFKMYLQPKITLHTNRVYGAEALVRWDSCDFGRLSPNRFIPLFEKNGMLQKLDTHMLKAVCDQLLAWEGSPLENLILSINVSRSYIFHPGFVKTFYKIVADKGVDPAKLNIEITESVIFDHSEELIHIIKELRSYGFGISMDDFGSGYSSLNMLKDIPLDIIKMDQVFFRNSQKNWERSKSVVRNVIRMAKDLNLLIIAEGVETKEEYAFLKECGCDAIQGYYFSKPLPKEEFQEYALKKNT